MHFNTFQRIYTNSCIKHSARKWFRLLTLQGWVKPRCKRNFNLDVFKNICFLFQDMDGGSACAIRAKNLLRQDLMWSDLPVQLEHYLWEANLGTAEPLEQLAGDLNVVREGSESIWRQLQTVLWLCIMLLHLRWCGSLYWESGVWGTFVFLCGFNRIYAYGTMCGCLVV